MGHYSQWQGMEFRPLSEIMEGKNRAVVFILQTQSSTQLCAKHLEFPPASGNIVST